MGKLSDKTRNARRPGKRERARVKRPIRCSCSGFVGGAYEYTAHAGRKKFGKVCAYVRSLVEQAHLVGESITPKSKGDARRPLYTVSSRPFTLLRSNVPHERANSGTPE